MSLLSVLFRYAAPAKSANNNFILAWTADSYIPENYQGKALPTQGGRIKVICMPTKKLPQNPDNLYYRWLLDGEIMGWAGGQGKAFFNFKATENAGQTHEVESQVLDENENVIWRSRINIRIAPTQILIKEKNSDYALKNNFSIATGKEAILSALPLFFQIKNLKELNFKWDFAGQTMSSPDDQNLDSLTLKIPNGNLAEPLTQKLSLTASNKNQKNQQASTNLDIKITNP